MISCAKVGISCWMRKYFIPKIMKVIYINTSPVPIYPSLDNFGRNACNDYIRFVKLFCYDTSPANDTIIGYYHILANFYAYLLLRLAETLLNSNSSALSSVSKYIEIRLFFPVIVMLAWLIILLNLSFPYLFCAALIYSVARYSFVPAPLWTSSEFT